MLICARVGGFQSVPLALSVLYIACQNPKQEEPVGAAPQSTASRLQCSMNNSVIMKRSLSSRKGDEGAGEIEYEYA